MFVCCGRLTVRKIGHGRLDIEHFVLKKGHGAFEDTGFG